MSLTDAVERISKQISIGSSIKPVIFVDFDGTVIDFTQRLYSLHRDLCKIEGIVPLKKSVYISMKRSRVKEYVLLKGLTSDETKIKEYLKKRLELIESREYLKLDKILSGSAVALRRLTKKYLLVLVTNRKSRKLLYEQLDTFGISDVFTDILVTEHKVTKERLIRTNRRYKDAILLLGDTDEDILLAKTLRIGSATVLTGLLDKKNASIMKTDYIVKDIAALEKRLLNP